MAASEFQRKALFFVLFAGVLALILFTLPFAESWIRDYLALHFGVVVTPEGRGVSADGVPVGKMTETTVTLLVTLLHIIKIGLWMALVISIVRFLAYLVFGTAFRSSGQSEISSLVRTVLSIIIYIVAFFIIFQSQYPDVQLAPLFTGSAILGIVVGLALQETLGNLFAGIALQADRPFEVGDVISIPNRGIGIVESVSWRGVKIRTNQNKLLVISNSVLGKETIEVAPRANVNARVVYFSTLYEHSPAKTIQVVREAVRQVENVSPKVRPLVRIKNLGESGIDWEVKYWLEDYSKYNSTDALIRQRIWYVFHREKIHFSYPTRTIHIEPKPEEVTVEEMIETNADRLSSVPIFAPLSDEETDKLAHASKARIFAPGEPIVRMGQEGNSMFVVIRGVVNVQVPENGVPKTVNTLRENDFFGEMSLLTGEPRSATVVASEETEVLQISKAALKPIFESNPDLVKSIGEIVEERRGALDQQLRASEAAEKTSDRSILQSIKSFFGLN
jgi:small-conductance mechanosensitive channel/CRP-like cAMP-binding protein